jgi:hypothetical protein
MASRRNAKISTRCCARLARIMCSGSAGALISLWAARTSPYIQHLAIFEPPLPVADTDLVAWLPRFDREIAKNNFADAMMTGIRGARVSPLFGLVPRFLLTPLLKLAINADAKKVRDGDVPLKEIIPTLHFDAKSVAEAKGSLESFKDVGAEVCCCSVAAKVQRI